MKNALPALLAILALLLLLFSATKCTPSLSRQQARGAVTATSEALLASSDACAAYALEKHELDLARTCRKHYDMGRVILIDLGHSVDMWDSYTEHNGITCALVRAIDELMAMAKDMQSVGVKVPPVVTDARMLVSAMGVCNGL